MVQILQEGHVVVTLEAVAKRPTNRIMVIRAASVQIVTRSYKGTFRGNKTTEVIPMYWIRSLNFLGRGA